MSTVFTAKTRKRGPKSSPPLVENLGRSEGSRQESTSFYGRLEEEEEEGDEETTFHLQKATASGHHHHHHPA